MTSASTPVRAALSQKRRRSSNSSRSSGASEGAAGSDTGPLSIPGRTLALEITPRAGPRARPQKISPALT